MSKVSIKYIHRDKVINKYDITANRVLFEHFSVTSKTIYPRYVKDVSSFVYKDLGWGD